MWLKVDRTNNNPEVTAGFFLNCVDELGGCPTLLRTDCGTENVIIVATQCFLRADDDDEFAGEKSHRYGASTTNQRVEAWWFYLRPSRLTSSKILLTVVLYLVAIQCVRNAYGSALQR